MTFSIEQISKMFEFVMQAVSIALGIFWYNDIDTLLTLSSLLPAVLTNSP